MQLGTDERVERKMLSGSKHRLTAAPWDVAKLNAPALMEPLAGRFAIQTDPNFKGRFITVVAGGGKITDVIHTDSFNPLGWEQVRFWVDSATGQLFAFQ